MCDVCGNEIPEGKDAPKMRLAIDDDRVTLDVCEKDRNLILRSFDSWTARLSDANPPAPRPKRANGSSGEEATDDEWTYLETRGFVRHRGRKTADELAALAERAEINAALLNN